MRVYVEGVGLRGPGLDGWTASRPTLIGAAPYSATPPTLPPCPLLPANERRRTVQTVKLALAVGTEAFDHAGRDISATATVFASSGGDGETIHDILRVLASPEPEISPTRFHNSVHNAPAGYWSIATRSHAPSSSLCCYDASFAAGLLEAAVQAAVDQRAVALIAYDLCYPEPLNSVRPIGATFGVALILAPQPTEASIACLDVELRSKSAGASVMTSMALEELREGTPAARSLPLLAALAQANSATLSFDYLPGLELGVSANAVVSGIAAAEVRLPEPPAGATMIGREQIAAMIPHAGAMSLLDGILHWDDSSIRCISGRHRSPDNPLRGARGLSGACGIEFAAQAMAVHGRLAGSAGGRPQAGYLASVRDVKCRQARLDLLEGDLIIAAERLMGDERQAIYQFSLNCLGVEVLSGRAAVVLDVASE